MPNIRQKVIHSGIDLYGFQEIVPVSDISMSLGVFPSFLFSTKPFHIFKEIKIVAVCSCVDFSSIPFFVRFSVAVNGFLHVGFFKSCV